ncbi:MAG: SCP2 sterol-binding domain-containing protein, partial [Pseudomonadales bacterium]
TVFQFHFVCDCPFLLTVTGVTLVFSTGMIDEPTVTIFVNNHETLWALMDGRYDGMRAFMEGKYRADGNIVLSQLLLYLFKSNDPTNIYQVQD